MSIEVKNLKGTSGKSCNCGSWLTHWENFSGEEALFCSALDCMNLAEVGAHIKLQGSNDTFIVPLCQEHNSIQDEYFEILDDVILVSANTSLTCDK